MSEPYVPPVPGEPPDETLANAVTIDDVRAAAQRLDGVAVRTPVMTSRQLDRRLAGEAFLKCESFQRVGAFKFRGAFNAMSRLSADTRERGVLTFSSGNHAQAVACSAALTGTPATIVMPDNAPAIKRAATEAYLADAPQGSAVVTYDPATQSREELGQRLAAERGLSIVPPYDHPDVIAGQGTVALELFEEVGELDWLFVCCGGGGLLSGCSVVSKAVSPSCRVVGVEPELGDDATRSFRSGRLQTVSNPQTIADGARTPYLGRYTFALVSEHTDEMMAVSEWEIAAAAVFAMQRMKLVVEPSGALGLAGALRLADEGPHVFNGSRIGVVVSGGNIDLGMIPQFLNLASG